MSATIAEEKTGDDSSEITTEKDVKGELLPQRAAHLLFHVLTSPCLVPVSSATTSIPSAADDNPRSPKRRRLSPTDDVERQLAEPQSRAAQPPQQPPNNTRPPSQPATGPPASAARPIPQAGHGVPSMAPLQPPNFQTLVEHLPTLDKQATQILTFLARLTPANALGLANTPNSPSTQEYRAIRSQFEQTRRFYNTGLPFLSYHDLGFRENSHVEIVRRSNQAIFVSSVFTGEIGLRDMDRSFLSVFVPENGRLLKPQASMYLELKTQGFITAYRTKAAPPSVVMADMFGPDLDKAMLSRRPGTTTLAPSEQEFLTRLASRRDILQAHVTSNTLDQLPQRYKWEDFSREVSSYLSKNMESTSTTNGQMDLNNNTVGALPRGQMEGQFSVQAPPPSMGAGEAFLSAVPSTSVIEPIDFDDFVAKAARAAEIALQGFSYPEQSTNAPTPPPPPPPPIPSTTAASQGHPEKTEPQQATSTPSNNHIGPITPATPSNCWRNTSCFANCAHFSSL